MFWGYDQAPQQTDAYSDFSPAAGGEELGIQFTPTAAGYVTGIQFYKGVLNTGPHVGNLWGPFGGDGTPLATATFSSESQSGWQQADFSQSVAVSPGFTYTASYLGTSGYFADDEGYFADGGPGVQGMQTANTRAPANGNGVELLDGGGFPSSADGANYWVQPIFYPAAPSADFALWAPQDLTATAVSDSAIRLTWTSDPPGATALTVLVSTDGNPFTQYAKLPPNQLACTVTGLDADKPYSFEVIASNPAGQSTPTVVAAGTLPVPVPINLTAAPVSESEIDLTWTDTSSGKTNFTVQRSPNGTTGWTTLEPPVAAGTTTFSDTGLTNGTLYYYRVFATDAAGTSAFSEVVSATPVPIPVPSGLTATAVSSTEIDLNWTDNASGRTGFTVQRSPNGTSGWTTLDPPVSPGVTSFQDLDAPEASTSYYRVAATDSAGTSAFSSTAYATTPYSTPTVAAVAAAGQSTVTGTTDTLSVLGAIAGGQESSLIYTWTVVSGPPGAVFSPNSTNAAKSSTVTFAAAGTYTLQATIQNGPLSVTSSVQVTVNQTLTSVIVPGPADSIAPGDTHQFTATALDQFSAPMVPQPAIAWSVVQGSGSVDSTGLYSSPGDAADGVVELQAACGDVSSAPITIVVDSASERYYKVIIGPPTVEDDPMTGSLSVTNPGWIKAKSPIDAIRQAVSGTVSCTDTDGENHETDTATFPSGIGTSFQVTASTIVLTVPADDGAEGENWWGVTVVPNAVNSTGDSGAKDPTASPWTGTLNSQGDPEVTLKSFMQFDNAASDPLPIAFDIPAADPGYRGQFYDIKTTDLPAITKPEEIDGMTQPGYAGSPIVAVDGCGFNVTADNTTIKGMDVINADTGIDLQGCGNCQIAANFIGIKPDGSTKAGNHIGILIDDGFQNSIKSNIISGNQQNGISITGGGSLDNTITGNLIGTNPGGDTAGAAFGNGGDGVLIGGGASENVIDSNTISGNFGDGLHITGDGTGQNIVSNDYVGTPTGGGTLYTLGLGNSSDGVLIDGGASANTVTSNVISANYQNGVHVSGANTSGNIVSDDLIGLDKAGDPAGVFGNTNDGILLDSGATSNTLERNTVSGNFGNGIHITGSGTNTNDVSTSNIGVNAAGLAAGNWKDGVLIDLAASSNSIDGSTISSNKQNGVHLSGSGTNGNTISGTFIGVASDGTTASGNSQSGVLMEGGAMSNTVGVALGGDGTSKANTIAFNELDGVTLTGSSTIDDSILQNSIYDNKRLGINLGGGTTFNYNQQVSPVAGPNNLQNFPVINSVESGGTYVTGHLNSVPNSAVHIELFGNNSADTNWNFQGHSFLYAVDVNTDGNGNADFHVVFGNPVSNVTATATDASGNTSEEFGIQVSNVSATLGGISQTSTDHDTAIFDNNTFAVPLGAGKMNYQAIMEPASTSMGSLLSWAVARNVDDALTGANAPITISDGGDNTLATLDNSPGQATAGSFNVMPYFDANHDGKYEKGGELAAFHLAIVSVSISVVSLDPSGAVFSASAISGRITDFSSGTKPSRAIRATAPQVVLRGGGADETIGVSKIGAGFVQNGESDSVVMSYGSAGTGHFTLTKGTFPILDSNSEASGGYSIMQAQPLDWESNPGGGRVASVLFSDSPDLQFDQTHSFNGNPATQATSLTGSLGFVNRLCGFSSDFNSSYVAYYSFRWSCVFSFTWNGMSWNGTESSVDLGDSNSSPQGADPGTTTNPIWIDSIGVEYQ